MNECCDRHQISKRPEAYVLHGNGAFNAFATRFLGTQYVVLLSDVVDAMDEHVDGVRLSIGHELGHLRMKHLTGHLFRWPILWLPLLGAAYSRARESTCDRHGRACSSSPGAAAQALAALSSGAVRWKRMDMLAYVGQEKESSGFWMSFHELITGYPWLTKRAARVIDDGAQIPKRNGFAYVLAIFVPYAGRLGGGFGLPVLVYVFGLLAAIALPAYQSFTIKSKVLTSMAASQAARDALASYYVSKQEVPDSLGTAGVPQQLPDGSTLSLDAERRILTHKTQVGEIIFTPSLDAVGRIVWGARTETGSSRPTFRPRAVAERRSRRGLGGPCAEHTRAWSVSAQRTCSNPRPGGVSHGGVSSPLTAGAHQVRKSWPLSRVAGLHTVAALAIPATAFAYTFQKIADMATSRLASFTAINHHGDVVWIDNGGDVTSWAVYSSVHGRITNDGFSDALPVINDSGQIAWQSGRAPVGNPSDWEVMLDGVRLTNNTGFDGEVNITNAGEVIWTGVGGIQSSTPGVLSAVGGSSLDVNELGEVVYRNGSNQIVSTTRGVIGGPGDHPSINDSGEVVWITLTRQVMSSTRGLIATGALSRPSTTTAWSCTPSSTAPTSTSTPTRMARRRLSRPVAPSASTTRSTTLVRSLSRSTTRSPESRPCGAPRPMRGACLSRARRHWQRWLPAALWWFVAGPDPGGAGSSRGRVRARRGFPVCMIVGEKP